MSQIKSQGLTAISETCKNFVNLELDYWRSSNFDDAAANVIAKGFRNLTSLVIDNCDTISLQAVIDIVRNHPNLTRLSFGGGSYDFKDSPYYFGGYRYFEKWSVPIEIAENCKGLISLDLSSPHRAISSSGIVAIAEDCKVLEELNLGGLGRLRDDAAIAIGKHCKNLMRLNLEGCWQLSDAAIAAIAEGCKNLKELNLSGCYEELTDETAIAIGEHCKSLTSLDLSGCEKLSYAGVIAIVRGCENLISLRVSWEQFSEAE